MTNQVDCPEWQYTDFLTDRSLLTARAATVIRLVHQLDEARTYHLMIDTRPVHGWYFRGLTPQGLEHYAGHYRGENLRCLAQYDVAVQSDQRVGHSHHRVIDSMREFAHSLERAVNELDYLKQVPNAVFSRELKLYRYIEISTALFVYFLEIHPYADGNGHTSRYLLYTFLLRYGVPLRDIRIEPRPPNPSFPKLLSRYRDGDRQGLEDFILNAIAD